MALRSVGEACRAITAPLTTSALDRPPSAKELFTSDAVAVLHEAASGSRRDIDRVAHDALRSSARRKRKLVERDVVQAGLKAERRGDLMMLDVKSLRDSPQLAAIELLIQAAETTVVALCAAHPALEHELRPDLEPVTDRLADRPFDRITCMRDGIHRH